jgi:muconolactone D-isomerase
VEFLVTIRQDWPALRDRPDLSAKVEEERRVGRDLIAEGVIARIWRLPGQRANVGVWHAKNATDLVTQLDRLPLRRWLIAEVLALATTSWRRGERAPARRGRRGRAAGPRGRCDVRAGSAGWWGRRERAAERRGRRDVRAERAGRPRRGEREVARRGRRGRAAGPPGAL